MLAISTTHAKLDPDLIHHRPHLVKHRSDLLKHRANVQDVLKAPHGSTMHVKFFRTLRTGVRFSKTNSRRSARERDFVQNFQGSARERDCHQNFQDAPHRSAIFFQNFQDAPHGSAILVERERS